MRVIVVGGGIGGLSAAIGLRRASHEVVVLERAPRLDPVGAGITLFGNAIRGLEQLGVGASVVPRGAPARHSSIMTADGRVLASIPKDLLEDAVAIHRGDLQATLGEAAGDVRLGAAVETVAEVRDRVVARLADGNEVHGDLLVGADGIHSLVRGEVHETAPRYAGYTAWRAVARVAVDPGRLTESWGIGERFGLIDIGLGRTYWFATKNTPEGQEDEPDGRKAELTRRFSGWHDPIAAVIEATAEDAILRNDVYDLEPLPRWSKGRIVLLGDAAHATTPGIGQGAAQAIEDAVVLAACVGSGGDLPQALGRYEDRRRPRTAQVLKLSRRADRLAQLDGALACRARNLLARALPASAQRRQLGPIVLSEP